MSRIWWKITHNLTTVGYLIFSHGFWLRLKLCNIRKHMRSVKPFYSCFAYQLPISPCYNNHSSWLSHPGVIAMWKVVIATIYVLGYGHHVIVIFWSGQTEDQSITFTHTVWIHRYFCTGVDCKTQYFCVSSLVSETNKNRLKQQ